MHRIVLAAAVVAVAATAAVAQQDPVTARRGLMKAIAQPHYGVLGAQAQGRQPYNQAQIDSALTALADQTAKIPASFPAGSNRGPDAGSDYYATAAAFQPQAKADIDAKVAAVVKAIQDSRGSVKDQASLRAAFTAINNACNACHEPYRARKG